MQIWDVVDRGVVRGRDKGRDKDKSRGVGEGEDQMSLEQQQLRGLVGGLGLGFTPGEHRFAPLDAESVDLYKNTQAVVFLVNPFERYVK